MLGEISCALYPYRIALVTIALLIAFSWSLEK